STRGRSSWRAAARRSGAAPSPPSRTWAASRTSSSTRPTSTATSISTARGRPTRPRPPTPRQRTEASLVVDDAAAAASPVRLRGGAQLLVQSDHVRGQATQLDRRRGRIHRQELEVPGPHDALPERPLHDVVLDAVRVDLLEPLR